ncbi:CDP-glycerol glycerophosphotransferase family protein [uncultured bacterium]|uniref:CDP-glycerol glycerophosphotransferase family protein n=2 Tax=Acetilactobacillus jinshanensis TaxID=1720083 RepID=A0A4V1ALW3_9LACO|nr:CDP-glycerol glycerophosphotransferase family protein [Acetilactobacillus jinshanensis]URL61896.1 CDP-glycerol glycerophosphotransferase family protein [uncultured bacterium]
MKSLYLWLVKVISLLHFHKDRKNVVYIMSFDNNMNLIYKIAKAMPEGHHLIVFYTRINPHQRAILALHRRRIRAICFKDGLRFVFKLLPIILSARLIICDNYYPFLGGLKLPKNVKVIQLWHADGAVKEFGWGDPDTAHQSRSDQHRYQSVYNHFDNYVVASKAMGQVFVNDYHIPFSRIRLLGYPRSDIFFNRKWIERSRRQVLKRYPQFRGRRIILYAPTYRKGVKYNPPIGLVKSLTSDPKAIVIVRLHPALRDQFSWIEQEIGFSSRLYYLNNASTAKLLTITNTLITDYSSVAFDYSLLPRAHSLIFFMYDLAKYQKMPGCQPNFLNWLPDSPVENVKDLARVIKQNKKTNLKAFNLRWNTYNDGHASDRFIHHYIEPLRRRN